MGRTLLRTGVLKQVCHCGCYNHCPKEGYPGLGSCVGWQPRVKSREEMRAPHAQLGRSAGGSCLAPNCCTAWIGLWQSVFPRPLAMQLPLLGRADHPFGGGGGLLLGHWAAERSPHTVVSLGVGLAVDHLSNPPPALVACAGSAKRDEHLPGLERGHKDLIHQWLLLFVLVLPALHHLNKEINKSLSYPPLKDSSWKQFGWHFEFSITHTVRLHSCCQINTSFNYQILFPP